MPADSPYPHWPRSDALDAEFLALRQRLDRTITLLATCAEYVTVIEQRLAGLQFAYNNAADYALARPVRPLSRRELEVLRLVARGMRNRAIARELGIGEGTVKNHLTSILAKLHVGNRMEAVRRARVLGSI